MHEQWTPKIAFASQMKQYNGLIKSPRFYIFPFVVLPYTYDCINRTKLDFHVGRLMLYFTFSFPLSFCWSANNKNKLHLNSKNLELFFLCHFIDLPTVRANYSLFSTNLGSLPLTFFLALLFIASSSIKIFVDLSRDIQMKEFINQITIKQENSNQIYVRKASMDQCLSGNNLPHKRNDLWALTPLLGYCSNISFSLSSI